MKRRIFATLLAFCLVASLCVVGAAAAGEECTNPDCAHKAAIGNLHYDTFEDALNASKANETIKLLNDAEVSYIGSVNKRPIDLNGHVLEYSGKTQITAEDMSIIDSSVSGSERGGTLKITGERVSTQTVFTVQNSVVNIENVKIESNGCVFTVLGANATLNITNSDVTSSGAYCVSTNANAPGNYGVDIILTGSNLTASSADGDNCTVMINVGGNLDITGCTITGDRQGVLARAGDVTIKNSEIKVTGKWAAQPGNAADKYHSEDWKSGNEVPSSALVVGNHNGNYNENAVVTVESTTLATESETIPAMYVDAPADKEYASDVGITGGSIIEGNVNSASAKNTLNIEGVTINGNVESTAGSVTVTDSTVTGTVSESAVVINSSVDGQPASDSVPDNVVAVIGGQHFESLETAIEAANDGDTVKLLRSTTGNGTIELSDGRSITLDMNGCDVGFDLDSRIIIYHGKLNITGSGTLYEEQPNYAPVMMYGSGENVADYSVVTIGPGVTLRGWAGLFIDPHSKHESQAYGIVANVHGTLKSERDIYNAGGHALYINGTITSNDGHVPRFILDGATLITEYGNGMYLAGYAETEIKDSTITSNSEGSTGIEIRAGRLKISGDTEITGGSGEFTVVPNGNGSTTGNVALAIVQHTTKLPLVVEVEDGTFTGGAALFEQNAQNNDAEAIAKISVEVTGGEYRGQVYSENMDSFIYSGNFSASVDRDYLADNLNAELYSPGSNPTAPYSYFDSVDDALAAARPGDVVTYIGDSTVQNYELKVDYGFGDVVTMNVPSGYEFALPELTRSGYTFNGWRSGGAFYRAGETLTVRGDTVLTAVWNLIEIPDTYEINVEAGANGEVDVSLNNASAGSVITITATPDDGYRVGAVTVSGPDGRVDVERVDATTYTFVMPAGVVEIDVSFVEDAALSEPFTDVSEGHWFYEYVAYVYTHGLMEGTSATTFEPDAGMTRAMFWAVLARIDGQSVSGANWLETARAWAMAEGVSDGTAASELVTREQMVTMLYRFAGSPVAGGMALSEFADAGSVGSWASDAMSWALGEGVISGMGGGVLSPQGTATRAQAAAILMRFVEG